MDGFTIALSFVGVAYFGIFILISISVYKRTPTPTFRPRLVPRNWHRDCWGKDRLISRSWSRGG